MAVFLPAEGSAFFSTSRQDAERLRLLDIRRNARILGRRGVSFHYVTLCFRSDESREVEAAALKAYRLGAATRERILRSRRLVARVRRFLRALSRRVSA